jgi:hypothetical protein
MVTATHDRRRDSRAEVNALEIWGQRSVFGAAKGWPWWAAVILALGLSIVGAFIDMHTSGNLGKVFEGAYFLGCVGAVCLVRRRNLFGPMVQPPLVLAVTIPVVVLLTKGMPAGSGTMSKLLTLGVPLVTGFPTMAVTTGFTVVIGGIRYLVQRKPAVDDAVDDDWDDLARDSRGEARRPSKDGERSAAARQRSASGASGRSAARSEDGSGRAARAGQDDRDGAGDRGRRPSASSRSESAREGRSASGRSAPDRERNRDREPDRERRAARGRGDSGERGKAGERGKSGERGQAPRSGQSRDRQPPRSGRPSRDDGRRQPRRRDDDDR